MNQTHEATLQAIGPAKTPPGLRTRAASVNNLFCSSVDRMWWSIVKQTTLSNDSPGKDIAVPSSHRTVRLPWNLWRRRSVRLQSDSTHVRCRTRCCSTSVAAPYPGPISSTSSPT
jgi:hypothetical protein